LEFKFLDYIIITKTKVLLSQVAVALDDIGYTV